MVAKRDDGLLPLGIRDAQRSIIHPAKLDHPRALPLPAAQVKLRCRPDISPLTCRPGEGTQSDAHKVSHPGFPSAPGAAEEGDHAQRR